MVTQQRRKKIEELLRNGAARTVELAEVLGVSVDTVRRDLGYLEKLRVVKRTHGGAMLAGKSALPAPDDPMLDAKQAIAREALNFLNGAETVVVDIGSTARQFARALAAMVPTPRLTVVTNDVHTSLELGAADNITVNLTGGRLEQGLFLCGPLTQQTLDSLYFDVAFMSTSGLTLAEGLTDPIPEAALVKRAFIERARLVVLLCDHTKFGRRHLMRVTPISTVHAIVTDEEAPAGMIEELRRQGIRVVLCSHKKIEGRITRGSEEHKERGSGS